MILILDRLEMHNHITDSIASNLSLGIWACLIRSSYEHCDWNLVDAGDINQWLCRFTDIVGRCVLLESVLIGILPPVNLRLD